jgi:hypothetical protein
MVASNGTFRIRSFEEVRFLFLDFLDGTPSADLDVRWENFSSKL